VLVDDTCKDDCSVHDEGFKYWLEVVETFGGKSPLLIFQNERGGRSKKIDEAGIKGRFPNVLQILRGDLIRPDAADGIRRAIEQARTVRNSIYKTTAAPRRSLSNAGTGHNTRRLR
jgi:internalin A